MKSLLYRKMHAKVKLLLFRRVLLFITLSVWIILLGQGDTGQRQQLHISISTSQLLNGDIIFRKGVGISSEFVTSVDEESIYSHIGIIQKFDDVHVYVIHVLPSVDSSSHPSFAKKESLDDFLSDSVAVAIYRLRDEYAQYANLAVQRAELYVGNVTFDLEFNLETEDSMYCTELVWKAYLGGNDGIDLIGNNFDIVTVPFIDQEKFILPSSIAKNNLLYQILTATAY